MLTAPSKIKIVRSTPLPRMPKATAIRFENAKIVFTLTNGGELAFSLTEFPKLRDATPEQRSQGKLVWGGTAARWDEIDEDISIQQLLTGEG